MAKVQLTGDVGRGNGDDEGPSAWVETGLVGVVGGGKVALRLPPGIEALLGGSKVIGFWQFGHVVHLLDVVRSVGRRGWI